MNYIRKYMDKRILNKIKKNIKNNYVNLNDGVIPCPMNNKYNLFVGKYKYTHHDTFVIIVFKGFKYIIKFGFIKNTEDPKLLLYGDDDFRHISIASDEFRKYIKYVRDFIKIETNNILENFLTRGGVL